jgi:hypothetical protein
LILRTPLQKFPIKLASIIYPISIGFLKPVTIQHPKNSEKIILEQELLFDTLSKNL